MGGGASALDGVGGSKCLTFSLNKKGLNWK